jgi:glycopeptide antibiotics resistance protein
MSLFYVLFLYERSFDLSWIVQGGFDTLIERQSDNLNLILFSRIFSYIQTMNYSTGMRNIIVNIGGHMLMLMPFGFFLPRINKRFQKLLFFVSITSLLMIFLEVLQFVSMSGSFDVDDALLNVIGAVLGFIFLRNPENLERTSHD